MRDVKTIVIVVVAAEHQVYTRYLPRELLVMLHSHVCQCNDQVTPIFLSKSPRVLSTTALVVYVNRVFLKVLEDVLPLVFHDAHETNLTASPLDYDLANAATNAFLTIERLILCQKVGHDPLTLALGLHSLAQNTVHLLNSKVQVMVSNAGHVDSNTVERGDHLLSLEHGADQRWTEQVTREDR